MNSVLVLDSASWATPWEAPVPHLVPVAFLALCGAALVLTPTERPQQAAASDALTERPTRQERLMTTPANATTDSRTQTSQARTAAGDLTSERVLQAGMKPMSLRRIVAGIGALSLVTALLTLIPAAMGLFSLIWPVLGFILAAASVVFMRVSTVKERRARIEAAFEAAIRAERESLDRVSGLQEDPRIVEERARRRRDARVFDDAEAAQRKADLLDAQHREEERLREELGRSSDDSEADRAESARAEGTWDPVEVPLPTYLTAPKATRHRPAPVQAQESSVAVPQSGAQVDAVPSRLDLDEVLRRRRA